jgi:cytochrome c
VSLRILAVLPLALIGACGGPQGRTAMPDPVRQCALCHTFEKGGARMAGPNLFGIIGEEAGVRPGFAFSPAMKTSGIVWTSETIDAFIAAPQKVVPGTRMAFAGESDPARRRAIVHYIQSLSAETKK